MRIHDVIKAVNHRNNLVITGVIIEITPRGYKVRESDGTIAHIDLKLFEVNKL